MRVTLVAVSLVIAVLLMLAARLALAPRWNVFTRLVPKYLVHRWTLGCMALLSLLLFFVVPFVFIGRYDVAAAGLTFCVLVTAFLGRDVLQWILDDLRDHRVEGRSPFTHCASCVANDAYDSHRARRPGTSLDEE